MNYSLNYEPTSEITIKDNRAYKQAYTGDCLFKLNSTTPLPENIDCKIYSEINSITIKKGKNGYYKLNSSYTNIPGIISIIFDIDGEIVKFELFIVPKDAVMGINQYINMLNFLDRNRVIWEVDNTYSSLAQRQYLSHNKLENTLRQLEFVVKKIVSSPQSTVIKSYRSTWNPSNKNFNKKILVSIASGKQTSKKISYQFSDNFDIPENRYLKTILTKILRRLLYQLEISEGNSFNNQNIVNSYYVGKSILKLLDSGKFSRVSFDKNSFLKGRNYFFRDSRYRTAVLLTNNIYDWTNCYTSAIHSRLVSSTPFIYQSFTFYILLNFFIDLGFTLESSNRPLSPQKTDTKEIEVRFMKKLKSVSLHITLLYESSGIIDSNKRPDFQILYYYSSDDKKFNNLSSKVFYCILDSKYRLLEDTTEWGVPHSIFDEAYIKYYKKFIEDVSFQTKEFSHVGSYLLHPTSTDEKIKSLHCESSFIFNKPNFAIEIADQVIASDYFSRKYENSADEDRKNFFEQPSYRFGGLCINASNIIDGPNETGDLRRLFNYLFHFIPYDAVTRPPEMSTPSRFSLIEYESILHPEKNSFCTRCGSVSIDDDSSDHKIKGRKLKCTDCGYSFYLAYCGNKVHRDSLSETYRPKLIHYDTDNFGFKPNPKSPYTVCVECGKTYDDLFPPQK